MISSGFVYDSAPYPQCHASTIVATSADRLAAAWFGGTRERDPDVAIYLAHWIDGRWHEPFEVANGLQRDGSRLPTWNPVLFQPPDGLLILFYKVGPSPSTWWGMVKTSDDGGRTWGEARQLPDGVLGPIKNKPVVLADGSWLSPSSTEDAANGWLIHFERSRDGGRTWQIIGPVEKGRDGQSFDAIQPSVLFHRDSSLQAVCRTRNGVLASTWSRDGGVTWDPLTATNVPNPNSGTDAVTLTDGRQLLVYNHSSPPPERPTKGPRYPLDVAVSSDGITWRRVLTLETEPRKSGYAYPAVIQAPGGLVHVTYTWDRMRIKHVVLDPKRL